MIKMHDIAARDVLPPSITGLKLPPRPRYFLPHPPARSAMLCIFAASLFALLCLSASPVSAAAVNTPANTPAAPKSHSAFAPHKALYDIELAYVRSGAQVTNVQGQMMYEWQPDCDGWLAAHKFDLHYDYADAPSMRVNSNFSTFESYDGRTMTFASKRARAGSVFEKLRGEAQLNTPAKSNDTKNSGGAAVYTLPEGLTFDLPAGTLFPMGHTLAVFDAMRDNKKFLYASVFDGSDDEGPVDINTFIGAPKPLPKNLAVSIKGEKNIDKTLVNDNPRAIRLAFFPKENVGHNANTSDKNNAPQNKDESESDDITARGGAAEYEMDMLMHDNGVISQMVIEYERFTVRQSLRALEKTENLCGN